MRCYCAISLTLLQGVATKASALSFVQVATYRQLLLLKVLHRVCPASPDPLDAASRWQEKLRDEQATCTTYR
jgi:hypothetical protein